MSSDGETGAAIQVIQDAVAPLDQLARYQVLREMWRRIVGADVPAALLTYGGTSFSSSV